MLLQQRQVVVASSDLKTQGLKGLNIQLLLQHADTVMLIEYSNMCQLCHIQ